MCLWKEAVGTQGLSLDCAGSISVSHCELLSALTFLPDRLSQVLHTHAHAHAQTPA